MICLTYVDDFLFHAPKEEVIQARISKLKEEKFELSMEDDVTGWLRKFLKRDDDAGTITLTQVGLMDCIIMALDLEDLKPKSTAAEYGALLEDGDGDPVEGSFNY